MEVAHKTPTGPPAITKELARFAAEATYESLPTALINRIRTDALDAVAVGIFGSTLPWVRLATGLWEEFRGTPQATVWGRSNRLPIAKAVLANSHAVNSFEFDDTYVWGGLGIHPNNQVVPTAIAACEMLGNVSGRAFLLALAVGHEVSVRVRKGIKVSKRGQYYTAICSTFGASATMGRLLGLDAEAMTWALGSAGSYVGGLLTHPPDAMVKRIITARAAEGGVLAAMLADRGFTGSTNLLEAEIGGFYDSVAQEADLNAVVDGLGQKYYSVNVHTKRFPMGTGAHAPIEATLQLLKEEEFSSDEISKVLVRTTSRAQKNMRGFMPKTISSAQLSLVFGIATALIKGNVLPEDFTEEALQDERIQRLVAVTEAIQDPELDELWRKGAGSAWPGQIEVHLKDGRVFVSPLVPEPSRMTDAEIEEKARHLCQPVIGAERSEGLIQFFRHVESYDSIDRLFSLI
jgi:2-methylcitrate dehydratase PrpD